MPLSDVDRLTRQSSAPAALMLWRALQPLRSVVRFMNSGAHPDDETSGMLAALALRDGISTSYVCSTRGEGGQNDLGREAGADLGTLRTAEMARAADVLGLSMYWLSTDPTDPITDFGFSKSGQETLARWGHTRTLRRLVEVIRADRPDILCPTFLDIPGQHGHHRAMTQAAHEAIAAAADPAFAADGDPWQVSKLYLPAWSGAGDAYDDDLPPPPETVRVPGQGREPLSGWTWDEIGQHSRMFHATQGMGRWVGGAESAGWPLHLAFSTVGPDRKTVTDNLPQYFADLVPDLDTAKALDSALAATANAFPDTAAVLEQAATALSLVRRLRDTCPPHAQNTTLHRLDRAEGALARVIYLASGLRVSGRFARDHARPGDHMPAALHLWVPGGAVSAQAEWLVPDGWQVNVDGIVLPDNAPPADPYPAVHHAHGPNGPVNLRLTMALHDQTVTLDLPAESPLLVLPFTEASISPVAVFCNSLSPRPVELRLSPGSVIAAPEGFALGHDGPVTWLGPLQSLSPGLQNLALTLDGRPAQQVSRIDHPHTGPLIRSAPAVLRLRVAEVALASGRVAYVGGGNDRVDHWLRAMGADVTTLSDGDLTSGSLTGFHTLVIGIFALRFRPALPALMPTIRAWVQAGGTLLTLYHRPWDNWQPGTTPPAWLEIGKPSLRFRVTDEAATVRHLEPDHPILTGPNRIGEADWEGWVKERGLYFAKDWDPVYHPLIEMADPNEHPQRGALLSGRIGKGRHSHCALILHLQMEALVPGAFRLMANLIAPDR
ncbi:MAG: PIG-L family deacetylase [Paracoccaceae bacterium]